MNDIEFQLFNQLFSIGVELLYSATLALFLLPFLNERKREKFFLILVVYAAADWFHSFIAAPQGMFGLLLLILLAMFSKILGLEKRTIFLLSVLYWNTKIAGALLSESLYFLLDQTFPMTQVPPDVVYLRGAGLLTLLGLSNAVLFSVMLYLLQRQIRKRHISLRRREICYIALVPVAGILFGQMISRLLVDYKDGVLFQLYERHPEFLAVTPALAFLFYTGTYLTIAFQQSMAALQEEQTAHCAEYQQIQAIRSRLREVEQVYTDIRSVKHDMRGHLTNMKGLIQNGEYNSLENYIARMDESINHIQWNVQTGNPVTDIIIGDVKRRSLALNICFQINFYYPQSGTYDAFDVGIILQNLLQNAVEACEKIKTGERFIILTGKRKGRFFLIEVRNSFTGEIIFGRDGLPVTTKTENASMHGIGLANVRREAEKYFGELEVKAVEQEFSATLLLQDNHS